ncbi:longitudinals lacking protein-like [Vespula squamosa]|uniref:Longitudinals lacking protein-like n=1 Tax=Vespula squamosa TaxID=30214 RepID=A0ABD2BM15_VESSQ
MYSANDLILHGLSAYSKFWTSTMAGEQQQFFLKWNDFQSNMVSSFKHLRDEKSFTDVTLACDGQTCKAHKMVLSACSPYFKSLLEENPSKHPIIILKDVAYSHLQAILEFMYAGEVNVSQDQLPAFLKTADRLKVKGLAEAPGAIKREG